MKRYLLFSGAQCYASGGWEDFKDSFETIEEAKESAKQLVDKDEYDSDWYHIVDTKTGKIVYKFKHACS